MQVDTAPHGAVKVMKWLEPSIMKRVGNKALSRWISLGLVLGMGVVGILLRAVSHQGPSPHPYWVVFLGCAGVGFAFDCARRMLSFVPSIAIVSSEGINLNTIIGIGAHLAFWPWHMIGSGQLEVAIVGYKSVRILTLYSHDQQPIGTIGMPLMTPAEQLAEAFLAMGKPLNASL